MERIGGNKKMKIAISTDSGNVSGHFGRCPEFTLAEVKDGEVKDKKVIENPGHKPGYIPKFLNEKEIDCLITGGIGNKAVSMFDEFGVRVITGLKGTDTDKVISQFIEGEIESGENPCSPGEGKGYGQKRQDR